MTLTGVLSPGSTVKYEVCNNGFDSAKTWEDATNKLSAGDTYVEGETK